MMHDKGMNRVKELNCEPYGMCISALILALIHLCFWISNLIGNLHVNLKDLLVHLQFVAFDRNWSQKRRRYGSMREGKRGKKY